MATIDELKAAQAEEKADLATLAGLVTAILTSVAAGTMSAADAQIILDEMHSQDSTIKTTIASIQAVLPQA